MSPVVTYSLSLFCVAIAYVLGSISFAVVVSRAMGLRDPRTFGSGNPGATNVLRTGNKTAAALTLLGDAGKGYVAVWLAHGLAVHFALSDLIVAASAVAVFLGHVYPLFLHFKGGKGVATALGVLAALQPWLAAAAAATWLAVATTSRYSSLAAVVAAVSAPIYYWLGSGALWAFSARLCIAIALIAALLIERHHANIGRLLTGQESRIGSRKNGNPQG
ncbi:MAG: glycerol-3-phosphate 1-O-acyltransferase PlsY [Candidimonas sp.]|nr:MAG: glycerol-3-phosphate 1-O-acyltransferase PlsY [Candidimonas sp.]